MLAVIMLLPHAPAGARAAGAAPAAATPPVVGARGRHFVGSARCEGCHAAETERWRGSHHDLALVPASPDAVLGDFAGAEFDEGAEHFRFVREGDRFFVEVSPVGAEAGQSVTRHEVVYLIGVDPLQQLMVAGPSGRLQALTVAWDVAAARWFSLHEGEPPPAGDAMHWQGLYFNWNTMCADCHGTHVERGYAPDADAYATTWAEIDVACEACHGPASAHVEAAIARAKKAPGAAPYRREELVVDTGGASSREQVDACGRCHARRRVITPVWVEGEPFFDHGVPATLDEGLYFADGQIEDEVYVYGSFTQSRMYAAGVRCTDCHDPHSLGLVAEGDALCTQCHAKAPGNDAFPAARGLYDDPSHHHHEAGAPGSACVDCHMPSRTYMKIDPRRDHKFFVPRPDVSLALGTPNACNGCHADRSNGWAAERVAELWGADGAKHGDDFATIFFDARRQDPASLSGLARIVADTGASPPVRATAVRLAGRFGESGVAIVTAAAGDPDPWVRTTAVEATLAWPPAERVRVVAPLLDDPLRSVRIAAARALAPFEAGGLPPEVKARLAAGLRELEASLSTWAGHPGNRLNLAVLAQDRGDLATAEAEYRRALELDARFIAARLNLVHVLDAQGRTAEVELLLREGIALDPDSGDMEYALGLVLAQEGRMREASTHLQRAAELLPGQPRVLYNLGLTYQRLGDARRARASFDAALRLAPDEVEVLRALAILAAQQGDWAGAAAHVDALLRVSPDDAGARALRLRIQHEMSDGR